MLYKYTFFVVALRRCPKLHLRNPLLVLDGLDLTTVHTLSSKEKWRSQDSNPGLLGEKRECYFCAMPPVAPATLVQIYIEV